MRRSIRHDISTISSGTNVIIEDTLIMKTQQLLIFFAAFFVTGLEALNAIQEPASVIVFAPHPDDDVIGCGGAIIQHVRKGDHVTIAYMTSGGARKWPGGAEELIRIREQEAAKAAALLGVQDLIFLREPDGHLIATPENREKVIHIILNYKPDLVYVTHEAEEHKDHKATFHIVLDAIAEVFKDGSKKPQILCYEVWTPFQRVSLVKNISNEMELKLQALGEHKSQLKPVNYVDAVKGLNRYRGLLKQKGAYAECFKEVQAGISPTADRK